ncbi:small rab GTPase Rab7a [Rhodotorula diobovata]|uniref:Small rab GTPase Rab7a n=1 Tax=Rhodotorula diobovata TaxID=5288 RepID=A0A5C5G2E2_9BASI|nr:small rab GTPase Rab7a [Rhodotorula diobovata]
MSHQTPLDAPPPPVAPRPPPVPLKAVLIGAASTGKTALRNRFVAGTFSEAYRATIGCDFRQKVVRVEGDDSDEEEVCINAWDTAGQERFRSLAPAFYRASDACVLVYSLADPSPPSTVTASIKSWFADFHDKCPDDEEEEQLRRFCWVCVGAKADEADPARASELSAAVERTLEELLPRRSGRQAAEAARRARERRKGKAPTVSVEVLHAPQERSGAPRKIRRAKRPVGQPAAPAPGRAPEPAPSSTAGTSSAGASTATTSATATPTFELDEPIADLLVATSPPTAPAHFGTAGAPPAVWLGGPFGKEGHVLEDGEGGGAVDVGESAVKDGEDDEGESEEEPEEERSEAERFADEGIKHFQRTSAKTGEGVDEVFSYIARRVLAARAYEGLTDEDEHAGTPYRRRRALGSGTKSEDVIRVNEQDARSFGQKVRSACCS